MNQYDRYLQQAAIQARNPSNSNQTGDEWLDRLTLDGYPVREILQSIFARYRSDSVGFGRYIVRRAASLKNCKYKVKNFVPRLPITMQVNQIVPLLMDKYRISSDGAKLLLQDYLWIYQEENEVYAELKKRGMIVLKHMQGRVNTAVFFCSEQMRSNYQRFGDVVCVDFKPITIRNMPKHRQYFIGVFTGQDTNLHHTLFGICLITAETYENYGIAVRQFLKAMRLKKYPQSFIVGNSQLLYKVIVQMSSTNGGNHRLFGCLMGWHHMMDKVAKIYKSHTLRDKIIQKFGNILSSLNVEQMNVKINELTLMLPQDEIIKKFIQDHKKFFVALNQPSFIGFGIEKYNFSMLYKIMYNFLREAQGIGFVFQQVLKMQEMLLSRIKKGYELIVEKQIEGMGIVFSDQLRYLSIRLEKKLFKKFLVMYRTAVKHAKIVAVSPDGLYYQIAFKTGKPTPYKGYIYTLKYSVQHSCWHCNCGFIYQSGIPCAHLIKIIRKFRGSLTYYINRRWMIQNSKFNPSLINHPSELQMRPEKDESQQERQPVSQVIQAREGFHNYDKYEQQKNMQMNQDEELSMDKDEYILGIDEDIELKQIIDQKINNHNNSVHAGNLEAGVEQTARKSQKSQESLHNIDSKQAQIDRMDEQYKYNELNYQPIIDKMVWEKKIQNNGKGTRQIYSLHSQNQQAKCELNCSQIIFTSTIQHVDLDQQGGNEKLILPQKKDCNNQQDSVKPEIAIVICHQVKEQIHEQIRKDNLLQDDDNKGKEASLAEQIKRKVFIEQIRLDESLDHQIPENNHPKMDGVQEHSKPKQNITTENLENYALNSRRTKRRVKSLFGPITISFDPDSLQEDKQENSLKIQEQNHLYESTNKNQLQQIKQVAEKDDESKTNQKEV